MLELDPTTKAVLRLIEQNGYRVTAGHEDDDRFVVTASQPGEPTRVVRGSDLYVIVCELAVQCGMELDDG